MWSHIVYAVCESISIQRNKLTGGLIGTLRGLGGFYFRVVTEFLSARLAQRSVRVGAISVGVSAPISPMSETHAEELFCTPGALRRREPYKHPYRYNTANGMNVRKIHGIRRRWSFQRTLLGALMMEDCSLSRKPNVPRRGFFMPDSSFLSDCVHKSGSLTKVTTRRTMPADVIRAEI